MVRLFDLKPTVKENLFCSGVFQQGGKQKGRSEHYIQTGLLYEEDPIKETLYIKFFQIQGRR